mmetsp:Transcript_6128/g.17241  ORF Transcript_6128/g.17241 Transcript_6128/m.17241 type:complete len:280 (-) Transcript_6128:500-1339(-)
MRAKLIVVQLFHAAVAAAELGIGVKPSHGAGQLLTMAVTESIIAKDKAMRHAVAFNASAMPLVANVAKTMMTSEAPILIASHHVNSFQIVPATVLMESWVVANLKIAKASSAPNRLTFSRNRSHRPIMEPVNTLVILNCAAMAEPTLIPIVVKPIKHRKTPIALATTPTTALTHELSWSTSPPKSSAVRTAPSSSCGPCHRTSSKNSCSVIASASSTALYSSIIACLAKSKRGRSCSNTSSSPPSNSSAASISSRELYCSDTFKSRSIGVDNARLVHRF